MLGELRFEMRESPRNLFANFRMLRADKTVWLVSITSATQGEGKSITTSMFAQTVGQLGQRVLLVDADLRRPMLHRYVDVDNGEGPANLLTDATVPLSRTVQPGLDLLPVGPMPPDATRLLSSERRGVVVAIRALEADILMLLVTPPAAAMAMGTATVSGDRAAMRPMPRRPRPARRRPRLRSGPAPAAAGALGAAAAGAVAR